MTDPRAARCRVLPAFIVRPAGFSFARLAALRFARSVAAARELAAASAARHAAGRDVDDALGRERYRDHAAFDDPAARRQLVRHIKRARMFAHQKAGELPAASLVEA